MATLEDLSRCFEGVVPATIATCSREGEPNISYLSSVTWVDPGHLALSCQFFNKTARNVRENPHASITMYDPVTFEAWVVLARFDHIETEGPLFDAMARRIEAIASHTGMTGVFRLRSADVYAVLSVERSEGFLSPADPLLDAAPAIDPNGPLTELRGLQAVSDRIAHATDLDALLAGALEALEENLGFTHSMVFLAEPGGERLVLRAGHGYGCAEGDADERPAVRVDVGSGVVGTVARTRQMLRVAGMGSELRYGRTMRSRVEAHGEGTSLAPEVPLPGLPDAQAQLALPLEAGTRFLGVLAVESDDPLRFDTWDETFLRIVANQFALGIERMAGQAVPSEGAGEAGAPGLHFTFYTCDDCVFFDGHYLVRGVPGRILWKVLREHEEEGRTEFTNRELRLDPDLGLPSYKDNLESRLILLRRRLEERCPAVRLASCARGRFRLELDGKAVLEER